MLVTVKSATWTRPFDTSGGLFDFAGRGDAIPAIEGALAEAAPTPLSYDVRLVAPSTLRIENDQARIVASADVNLRGTYDRPLVLGRADIERGEVRFEGRRYLVTRGSLDFTNPDRIQPFFDIEAETRVRVPRPDLPRHAAHGGDHRAAAAGVHVGPAAAAARHPDDAVQRLRRRAATSSWPRSSGPTSAQQRLLEARATRALTGTLSAEVGRVVQETFGVDSFQITPLLVDPYQQSARLNVNPSARVTIGKRISDRIYLTYARSLSSSTRDEIILLEFDQSESLAWVLSQNEDRTYALEVRKRHTF